MQIPLIPFICDVLRLYALTGITVGSTFMFSFLNCQLIVFFVLKRVFEMTALLTDVYMHAKPFLLCKSIKNLLCTTLFCFIFTLLIKNAKQKVFDSNPIYFAGLIYTQS